MLLASRSEVPVFCDQLVCPVRAPWQCPSCGPAQEPRHADFAALTLCPTLLVTQPAAPLLPSPAFPADLLHPVHSPSRPGGGSRKGPVVCPGVSRGLWLQFARNVVTRGSVLLRLAPELCGHSRHHGHLPCTAVHGQVGGCSLAFLAFVTRDSSSRVFPECGGFDVVQPTVLDQVEVFLRWPSV